MTSVLKRFAQIDPSVQNFYVIGDCSGWAITPSGISSPVMSVTDFNTAFDPSSNIVAGSLLKDLGRQITVYDPSTSLASPHVAIFRQVMVMNGASNEGISNRIFYICVWTGSTPGTPFPLARVVRTGH